MKKTTWQEALLMIMLAAGNATLWVLKWEWLAIFSIVLAVLAIRNDQQK